MGRLHPAGRVALKPPPQYLRERRGELTTAVKEPELTKDAFEKLLDWLDADRERAGQRYEEVRARLMRFFEWQGCIYPEEYTDQTINRVARKLSEGVEVLAADPYVYFAGVARMVLKEYWRRSERMPTDSIKVEPRDNQPEAEAEMKRLLLERRLQCMEACLQALAPKSRELITEYYREEERVKTKTRKRLAERLGIPMNALRIRCCRIRNSLEECINGCLRRQS